MARSQYVYLFQRGDVVLAAFTVKWEAYAWLRANGAKTPGFADGLRFYRMTDCKYASISEEGKKNPLPLVDGFEIR